MNTPNLPEAPARPLKGRNNERIVLEDLRKKGVKEALAAIPAAHKCQVTIAYSSSYSARRWVVSPESWAAVSHLVTE